MAICLILESFLASMSSAYSDLSRRLATRIWWQNILQRIKALEGVTSSVQRQGQRKSTKTTKAEKYRRKRQLGPAMLNVSGAAKRKEATGVLHFVCVIMALALVLVMILVRTSSAVCFPPHDQYLLCMIPTARWLVWNWSLDLLLACTPQSVGGSRQ